MDDLDVLKELRNYLLSVQTADTKMIAIKNMATSYLARLLAIAYPLTTSPTDVKNWDMYNKNLVKDTWGVLLVLRERLKLTGELVMKGIKILEKLKD